MFDSFIRVGVVALQVAATAILMAAVQLGGLFAIAEVLLIIATEVVLSLSNLVLACFKSGLQGDEFVRGAGDVRRRMEIAGGKESAGGEKIAGGKELAGIEEIVGGKESAGGNEIAGGMDIVGGDKETVSRKLSGGNHLPDHREESPDLSVRRRRKCYIGYVDVLDDL